MHPRRFSLLTRHGLGLLGLALATAFLPAACADGEDLDPQIGRTECGSFGGDTVLCEAGYHCADPSFSQCEPGCTTDRNCVANQECVKAAQQTVGTCDEIGGGSGGSTSSTGSSMGSCDAAPGYTSCSFSSLTENCCQPGQYCEDASFEDCAIGCLSQENCTEDQTCDLTGGPPGTCVSR